MSTILAILNSDRIHKARKAIAAGVAAGGGLLVSKVTSGQPVSGADVAQAAGAFVVAFLLVYLVPNRA